jgi:hypothetical protein
MLFVVGLVLGIAVVPVVLDELVCAAAISGMAPIAIASRV